MKRTLVIMMALGMVIAFATPAAAKKGGGGNGGGATAIYSVEVGGDLATTCSGDIAMTGSLNSNLSGTAARLSVADGSPLAEVLDDGCQVWSRSDLPNLWLTFRPDKVLIQWRFGDMWDGSTLLQAYELEGTLELTGGVSSGATASGDVTISEFTRQGKKGTWTELATVSISLMLTITPES